jgi:hypothetical protein
LRQGIEQDHVPVDDRSEGLVHPHAVEIDRKPGRRSQERRRLEPTIGNVGLIRAARSVADCDRAEIGIEQIGKIGGMLPVKSIRAQH